LERFVDFHLHVENLIRYYVPLHQTPKWVRTENMAHKLYVDSSSSL